MTPGWIKPNWLHSKCDNRWQHQGISLLTNNFWKWCTKIILIGNSLTENNSIDSVTLFFFSNDYCLSLQLFHIVLILEQWGWKDRFWDSASQIKYLHPVPFPPKIRTLGKCSTYKRALYLTSTSSAILNFTQKPISYQNGSLCQFLC